MNEKLKALEESISLADAERLSDELASFDGNHSLSDDEQQRILSSVMRKAGFEMKENMVTKKTRKHGRRFAGFVIAAALLTSGAIGAGAYGLYVDHHLNVDNYLGKGAADTLEQQGLFDGSETVVSEHLKITQETVLSTGNITSVIFTFEGIDDEGKALINSHTKTLSVRYENSSEELFNVLEMGSMGREEGDGYEVYMYTRFYRTPEQPITCPISLYLVDVENMAYPEYGEFIGTVEFTTEPNVEGITFIGEQSGKTFELYDFALTSDEYIPIDKEAWGFEIEYQDGSTAVFDNRDLNDLGHAALDGVTTLTDVETQTNTRAVFSKLIGSENVSAVTIDGERYLRQ